MQRQKEAMELHVCNLYYFSSQLGLVSSLKCSLLLEQKVAKTKCRPQPLSLNMEPKVEAITLTLVFYFLYIIAYTA